MPQPAPSKPNKFWALVVILLLTVLIISVAVAWTRYKPSRPIEVSLPAETRFQGDIQVGGAVSNPGIYPFNSTDTIGSILLSAGGSHTGQTSLSLSVTDPVTQKSPQKININRAEAWLLEALPGIGGTRAKAIIAYREQNGFFRQTSELMKVAGIGQSIYDGLKDLITVSE